MRLILPCLALWGCTIDGPTWCQDTCAERGSVFESYDRRVIAGRARHFCECSPRSAMDEDTDGDTSD